MRIVFTVRCRGSVNTDLVVQPSHVVVPESPAVAQVPGLLAASVVYKGLPAAAALFVGQDLCDKVASLPRCAGFQRKCDR